MKRKSFAAFAVATLGVLASGAALAQSATADGVLRKIDADNGRVIIKHGDFRGYAMPAMTMAFNVPERALLEGLKVQDPVRFAVRKDGRDWTITDIKPISQQAAAQDARHAH